jgi:hypothetical protein
MKNNKVLVITSFNEKLFKDYAYRFVKTYNLPFELKIYTEKLFDIKEKYGCKYPLIELNNDSKLFVKRNKNKFFRDYIHDGVRFSYKVYAITQAAIDIKDYDILIWIDADSVFYKPFEIDFIKKNLYDQNKMMTYLGRGTRYSECGFLLWNLKHKDTQNYFKEMKKMYDEDLIYDQEEHHDSYIWDLVRKKFEKERGVVNIDIGLKEIHGHVHAESILSNYFDHLKGPERKKLGKSWEFKL